MTRSLIFDSPFLLGFDHMRDLVDRASRAASEGYPPYNVEETGDGRLRITLAVAGFAPDQLQVTVEDNQLVVTGRRDGEAAPKDAAPKNPGERAYLHRGIAARGFIRNFVLADGMEIEGAALEHGLLHIDVTRRQPEKLVKRIPIKAAG